MDPASPLPAPAHELPVLYELSLAAGGELDLSETCHRFLDLLKARCGFDYAAVWIRRELMPDAHRLSARERDGLGLAFASPASQVATAEISALHPLVQRCEDAPWSVVAADEPAFGQLVMERAVDGGAYVVYRLRDVGLLKLHASASRSLPSAASVERLGDVVERFGAAVEVCLDHQLLLEEQRRRRLAERRARDADRAAGVGRLADGLGRLLRPLVKTIVDRALPLRRLGPVVASELDWVVDSARRADQLCQQLAELAEPDVESERRLDAQPVGDFDALVDRVLLRATRETPDGVRVRREQRGSLPEVRGDADRLEDALQTLLAHAVDASEPGGGVVTVRTMLEHVRESDLLHAPFSCLRRAGDHVCVEVEDQGAGMDEATKAALFEPFSPSSKDLGLAAARGVVRRHRGTIVVESAPGAGTCLRVLLPVAAASRVLREGERERAQYG